MDNKFDISNEMLEKIISHEAMNLTYSDIEELMDAELEKEPEEMDLDFVKTCAEILNNRFNPIEGEEHSPEATMIFPEENSAQPVVLEAKRSVKAGKLILIAAVVALLCAVAIPVGAKLIHGELSDKIIAFYYDCFKIDLRGEASKNSENRNLINNIKNGNFDGLKLPAALLTDDYSKEVNVQEEDKIITATIKLNKYINITEGTIYITFYMDENIQQNNGVGNVSVMYKYFEQIIVNNTDVLVFGNDEKIYIKYMTDNIEYEIVLLKTDFDTAVAVAESIK